MARLSDDSASVVAEVLKLDTVNKHLFGSIVVRKEKKLRNIWKMSCINIIKLGDVCFQLMLSVFEVDDVMVALRSLLVGRYMSSREDAEW